MLVCYKSPGLPAWESADLHHHPSPAFSQSQQAAVSPWRAPFRHPFSGPARAPSQLSHAPSARLRVSMHSVFFDGQHCIILCPLRLLIPAWGRSASLSAVAVTVTVCSSIGRINAPSARFSSLYAADSWNCSCIRFRFSAWRKPFPLAGSH